MRVSPEVCLLVPDWGIGDHYIVGAFADAVRRHHGVKVWMAGRPHLGFVGELYPAVERSLPWPAELDAPALSSWKIEAGKIFYAHFPKLELMRAVGYRDFHFLDAYRCRLGLPAGANPTRPRQPNAVELAAAADLLRRHGREPGRTVVFSLEARTTPTDGVDAAFWVALARELEAEGLQVLVNAGPGTVVPVGLGAAKLPLPLFRAVVASAGFFCSVRSGLSDLACDLRVPQVVVYPDVGYWAGGLRAGTTFERFGLTKVPHEVTLRAGYDRAEVRAVADYFLARVVRPAVLAGGS
jgi:hypothetical protein